MIFRSQIGTGDAILRETMAIFKRLVPSDYTIQRWKNGLGSTSQLAIEPATSKFPIDPFLWRVSSARVNASGPFSKFPGYERTLILIEGSELRLSEKVGDAESGVATLRPFEKISFGGEREIVAQIPSDADLIDYNVFWRRDSVEARSEVIDRNWESVISEGYGAGLSFFVTVIGGRCSVESAMPGLRLELGDWESLHVDIAAHEDLAAVSLRVTPLANGSRAILSEFRKLRR